MEIFKVKIKGTTPFLMSKFSDEAMEQLSGGKKMKSVQKKELSKEDTAEEGVYRMPDKTIYIPSEMFEGAIKNASIGKKLGKVSVKQFAAGSIRVFPEKISLKTKKISGIDTRTAVNRQMRARIVKHRAFMFPWACELEIHYLATHLTKEVIITLLKEAGIRFGIGTFAPRHGGKFGMFKVSA